MTYQLCGHEPTLSWWQVGLLQDSLQHWILPRATCFDDLLHMLKVNVPVAQKLRVALLQVVVKWLHSGCLKKNMKLCAMTDN